MLSRQLPLFFKGQQGESLDTSRNEVTLPSSLSKQIGLSSSLIIICHSRNFASLNCKARTGRGKRAHAHTSKALPSVPRAGTHELIRASRGLHVLSGISMLTSIQPLTSIGWLGSFLLWILIFFLE